MEDVQEIKRGVAFDNRIGETTRRALAWWNGGRFNKETFLFLLIIWALNIIVVYPIFGRDLTPAYTSCPYLISIADFFHRFLNIPQRAFFGVLTFCSVSFFPVSFYLYVRKIAMRHEITAFIAALLFLLPSPFFGNVPIVASAIIQGDGAHILVLSFIPIFLLYVQTFIATGAPVLFFLTAIVLSFLAVISPFSVFNFVIFLGVLLIGEGFLGNLRIKLIRAFSLLITTGLLAFYWYYPGAVIKFMALPYIQQAIAKLLWIMPAAIPIIPVAGALTFLVFDRREKLKPIFISLTLFIIYITIYWLSGQLGIGSIFTSDRYLPELILATSFFLAVILVLLTGFVIARFLPKLKGRKAFLKTILLVTIGVCIVGFLLISGIGDAHEYLRSGKIVNTYSQGIVPIRGFINFRDFTSILANLVSLGTFASLIYMIRRFPLKLKRRAK